MEKRNALRGTQIYNGVMTMVGGAVMGISMDLFLIPLNLASGGVGGLATVVGYLTHWSVGFLILLFNIPIFILGLCYFNWRFLINSLLGTLALSAATHAFSWVAPMTQDALLSSVLGGAGVGLGLGIAMRAGGTTGGSDILAMVFQKQFPTHSVGDFFLLVDGCVIPLAGLVFGNWEVVLYSVLALFVSTKVVDAVLKGVDYAEMVYVISKKPQEITQEIFDQMGRGVTGLESVSMYTGEARPVLLCVVRRTELPKLKRLVRETDSEAFVIVSSAREVLGEGFKEI